MSLCLKSEANQRVVVSKCDRLENEEYPHPARRLDFGSSDEYYLSDDNRSSAACTSLCGESADDESRSYMNVLSSENNGLQKYWTRV